MKDIILNFSNTLIDTSVLDGELTSNDISDVGSAIELCKLYKGAERVLKRIKHNKIPVCVITKINTSLSKNILTLCGVPYKEIILYDGKTTASYEDALRKAIQHLGVKPEYAISLCSETIDVSASNNVGIQSVYCKWGGSDEKEAVSLSKDIATVPIELIPLFFPEAFDEIYDKHYKVDSKRKIVYSEDSYDECEKMFNERLTGPFNGIYTDAEFYRNWADKQHVFSDICQAAAKKHLQGCFQEIFDIEWKNNPNANIVKFGVPHIIYGYQVVEDDVPYKDVVLNMIEENDPLFCNETFDEIVEFISTVREGCSSFSDDDDELMVYFADSGLDKAITEHQFNYLSSRLSEKGITAKPFNKNSHSIPNTASYIIIELASTPETIRSVCESAIGLKEKCHETCCKKALGIGCYTNLAYLSLVMGPQFTINNENDDMTSPNSFDSPTKESNYPLKDKSVTTETKEQSEEQQTANDAFEVEGVKLDPDNQEFTMALEYALHTNKSFYLTGKAGSGKTTFLKYLKKITKKEMVILAPTGVAAIRAGGQTIHSFFKIKPSLYVPGDKRLRTFAPANDSDKSTIFDNFKYNVNDLKLLRSLELMVIDEVSMVRADLLDVVDSILRVFRRNNQPFGGVQVILVGDTFQLPPVIARDEKNLLYSFYDSEFFFSSQVMKRTMPIYIELKKIYRQSDRDFISLLNRIRVNRMLPEDFRTLNSRLNPWFQPNEGDNYITLTTRNDRASEVNEDKLRKLNAPLQTYVAEIQGEFPEKNRPTDTVLRLKIGAQVMFVKNNWQVGYYNGKIGTITAADDDKVKVEVEDENNGERRELLVERVCWENIKYSWDKENGCIKEEVIGLFRQLPLRLAWAITVHKSQGLTFEKVIADVGSSFASGQVYVALSRCTSLNGLVLTSVITPRSVLTDRRVIEFAQNETPETLLTEQLSDGKADYYYAEARKALLNRNAYKMVDNFLSAIKYRNDITSNSFKRYISVWAERLFLSEKNGQELEKRQKESEASFREREEETLKLQEQIKVLENDIKEKRASIAKITEELATTRESLSVKEKNLFSANHRIRELEDKIEQLEAQKKSQEAEITRLSSITWYQKLFGKK